MSLDTINYLLSKYYEALTNRQFLYQNELENPSVYPSDEVEPLIKYRVEIDFLKKLIEEVEVLKECMGDFNI